MRNKENLRTWIEVQAKAIRSNYQLFRRLCGKSTLLMSVVKSNAYGHGLRDFGRTVGSFGVDWFGVDSITEARALRQGGLKQPILVLGYTLPSNYLFAKQKNISVTVANFETLKSAIRFGKHLAAHIKVDTGMHRQGFFLTDLPKVIALLKENRRIRLEGLYTHFAKAKDPTERGDTQKQLAIFARAVDLFHKGGMQPLLHAAATGGTINFPESRYDLVRVGIGMYGLWPSPETFRHFAKKLELKSVLSWKTLVSEVKPIASGERVGYDYTEKLRRDSKIAIIPVGYWHGFDRRFSSIGHVLIRGKRARVLGRVSMDMSVVDVTDIPGARVGDEVVLIGSQGRDRITADELAKIANTIPYEIVTRINPLIQKYYV